MYLRELTVAGFRGFRDPTAIDLRPVTLFFGYNGAGKSSLLRALPLLAASSRGQRYPLAVESVFPGATLQHLVSRWKGGPIVLELKWAPTPDNLLSLARFEIRELDQRWIIERLTLEADGNTSQLVFQAFQGDALEYTVNGKGPVILSFEGLWPEQDHLPEPLDILKLLRLRLRELTASVQWLRAIRATPPRVARPAREEMASAGENASAIFAADWAGDRKLSQKLNDWSRVHLKLEFSGSPQGDVYEILVTRDAQVFPVPLADAGEGWGQLFPVLVLGAQVMAGYYPPHTILALEQPELHLHPAGEVALAEFLAAVAASASQPRLLVETHSPALLYGFQLQVLKGALRPEDLLIYWVSSDDGPSQVIRTTLDADARLSPPLPLEVFTEQTQQAREIFEARRKRSAP